MASSNVVKMDEYRVRRDRRLRKALALHSGDRRRAEVIRQMSKVLHRVGADRGATLWLNEFAPEIVHPHAVVDLLSDEPRRDFSLSLVQRVWDMGLPGLLDVPDRAHESIQGLHDTSRSFVCVAMGSDGIRSWFFLLDSAQPREALEPKVIEEVLFVAGECCSVIINQDLLESMDDPDDPASPAHFAGWPILQDVDDKEPDKELRSRISARFLVARAVRAVLDDGMVWDQESLDRQSQDVRESLPNEAGLAREHGLWEEVLDALPSGDLRRIAGSIVALGVEAEDQGHWNGAIELHRMANQIAAAASAEDLSIDSARFLARAHRRRGDWDESAEWYDRAREVAELCADRRRQVLVLDGLAHLHLVQGGVPKARQVLGRAIECAEGIADPHARGSLFYSMMTVAHTEGALSEAARFGWRALHEYRDEQDKLQALTALGGVLLEARDLEAAEDAFTIVERNATSRLYRLYALEGLACVAGFSGRRHLFEQRISDLERAGLRDGAPFFQAEAFLERGDCYLHLGDEQEARRWYKEALTLAEESGVNEYEIRAETALKRLDDRPEAGRLLRTVTAPTEEFEEIRGGLASLRSAHSSALAG